MSSAAPARRKASSIITRAPNPTAERMVACEITTGERVVQGLGEVRCRVDQRAVEIENDRRISQIGARHFKSSVGLHVDRGRPARHISSLAFQG
jgi:hypothetical protein